MSSASTLEVIEVDSCRPRPRVGPDSLMLVDVGGRWQSEIQFASIVNHGEKEGVVTSKDSGQWEMAKVLTTPPLLDGGNNRISRGEIGCGSLTALSVG